MGSLTLMARLFERPDDPSLWKLFVDRYSGPVADWTRRWFDDPNDRDEMFCEFFQRIYKLITVARRRFEPSDGSFRGVLYTILHNQCMDYLKRRKLGPVGGDAGMVEDERWSKRAAEGFIDQLEELEDQEMEQEREMNRLDEYRERYRLALINRKAQFQYDPKSTEIFFKKYHELVPTERLDTMYSFKSRDSSGRYARRERDRLIVLMGLPTTNGRARLSEAIITTLARIYGDLSAQPE